MSDVITGPGVPDSDGAGEAGTGTIDTKIVAPEGQPDAAGDTFPREVVESLRRENADHRTKTKAAEDRADALATRLHRELVTATARLENPNDLPFDAEHLDDADKLSAALDALLSDRPYMAKRVVKGDAGQGARGGSDEAPKDFGDLFRRAR